MSKQLHALWESDAENAKAMGLSTDFYIIRGLLSVLFLCLEKPRGTTGWHLLASVLGKAKRDGRVRYPPSERLVWER